MGAVVSAAGNDGNSGAYVGQAHGKGNALLCGWPDLLDDRRHIEDEEAFRLTRIVTDSGKPVVVMTGAANEAVGEPACLQTNGIDLHAGVPLRLHDGTRVGAPALLDYEPRAFSEEDVARLKAEAEDLVRRFAPAALAQWRERRQSATTCSSSQRATGQALRK